MSINVYVVGEEAKSEVQEREPEGWYIRETLGMAVHNPMGIVRVIREREENGIRSYIVGVDTHYE